MSLHDTDALIVETATATESLPDPTTVTSRSHILFNTGYPVTAVWSASGPPLPFLENSVSVATISVLPGQLKIVHSDGAQWVVSSLVTVGDVVAAPVIQSAHHANVGTFTLTAAAHGATAGYFWLLNPVGSGVILDVRKVWVNTAPGATAVLTPPTSLTIERMTFTGAPTGPTVTAAVRDTNDPAAVGTIRTTSGGIVPTAGAKAHAFTAQSMVGAIGANLTNSVPVDQVWPGDVDTNEHLVLRPGQGVVFRQDTAGAALLENRTIRVDIEWDERLP